MTERTAIFLTSDILPFYGGFAEGVHLFPSRTEQLSPSWPMVLGFYPWESR